jgi:hypothetical protein
MRESLSTNGTETIYIYIYIYNEANCNNHPNKIKETLILLLD